ncbi:MAG: hypothetical protein ACK5O7_06325 [Holosporales bacterium]
MKYGLILSFALVTLAGCSTPAQVSNMVAHEGKVETQKAQSKYANSIHVETVSGGEETDPLWKSKVSSQDFANALIETLKTHNLYAENGRYVLTAHLKELDQPDIGFDFTVKAKVHYTLEERNTGKTLFLDTLESSYTASFGDHLYGAERLRLANEGAIRTNIEMLLKRLSE